MLHKQSEKWEIWGFVFAQKDIKTLYFVEKARPPNTSWQHKKNKHTHISWWRCHWWCRRLVSQGEMRWEALSFFAWPSLFLFFSCLQLHFLSLQVYSSVTLNSKRKQGNQVFGEYINGDEQMQQMLTKHTPNIYLCIILSHGFFIFRLFFSPHVKSPGKV